MVNTTHSAISSSASRQFRHQPVCYRSDAPPLADRDEDEPDELDELDERLLDELLLELLPVLELDELDVDEALLELLDELDDEVDEALDDELDDAGHDGHVRRPRQVAAGRATAVEQAARVPPPV